MEILDDYGISVPVRRKLATLDLRKQRAILYLGVICIALLLLSLIKCKSAPEIEMIINDNQFESSVTHLEDAPCL